MTAIELINCEIGTIRSRKDHSVVFSVETPELRASESGLLMQWHGRAATVTIKPHDGPPLEMVSVDTERAVKTPGQRLRGVLFLIWNQAKVGTFDSWYAQRMETLIEDAKRELP